MQRRARIALFNRLFAKSIVTRCLDEGGKIPPWGKGLKPNGSQTGSILHALFIFVHKNVKLLFSNEIPEILNSHAAVPVPFSTRVYFFGRPIYVSWQGYNKETAQ